MRKIRTFAIRIRRPSTLFQIFKERFSLMHVKAALRLFFASIYLKQNIKNFALTICSRSTNLLQLFHRFNVRDRMDAVRHKSRLLELVTLHRTNYMTTHADSRPSQHAARRTSVPPLARDSRQNPSHQAQSHFP